MCWESKLRISVVCVVALFAMNGCANKTVVGSRGTSDLSRHDVEAERADPRRRCYEAIRSAGSDMDYGEEPYEIAVDYWGEVLRHAHERLWKCLANTEESERSEVLRGLVSGFGSEGAQTDLRLLLSDYHVMVPYRGSPAKMPIPQQAEGLDNPDEGYDEICRYVWQHQVERFLERPDLRERYYRFTLWTRQFVAPGGALHTAARYTHTGFSTEVGEYYWFFARNFIVLATATEREDLLQDAEPDELAEHFERWYEWYKEVQDTLVFDKGGLKWKVPWVRVDCLSDRQPRLPEDMTPFEDWSSPPPPPPSHILRMYRQRVVIPKGS